MSVKKLRKISNEEVSIEQEMTSLNDCFEALQRLKNYRAEMRILRYLTERWKSDIDRKYSDD